MARFFFFFFFNEKWHSQEIARKVGRSPKQWSVGRNEGAPPSGSLVYICRILFSRSGLFDPTDLHSTPDFPVLDHLPELAQTHVHWVSDAIQPLHTLSSPSPLALNLSQRQHLFQWVGSSHQVAKVLELQLQHQSSQWIFRVDFL